MSERGILFGAPMVRGLWQGRKGQTRRILSLPTKTHSGGPIYERSDMGGWEVTTHGGDGEFTFGKDGRRQPVPERAGLWHKTTGVCVAVTCGIGDRLWVREAWRVHRAYDDLKPSELGGDQTVWFEADRDNCDQHGRYRHARFMPRWASRMTLTVTDVRVQRLQEISEEDAEAEGCVWDSADGHDVWYVPGANTSRDGATAVECYSIQWDSLHTTPGERWQDDPWIVAISFGVTRANIDNLHLIGPAA